MYGVFDTQDKLWIGTLEGPALYRQKDLARVAAMVAAKRHGTALTRFIAKRFRLKSARLRDELPVLKQYQGKRGTRRALRELEDGV